MKTAGGWVASRVGVKTTPSLGEDAMCEIGEPIEIIEVETLKVPAPLQRTKNEPERQPAVVAAGPVTETTLVEKP